jgi:hypothetical protein
MMAMQLLLVGCYMGLALGLLRTVQNPAEAVMTLEERAVVARG